MQLQLLCHEHLDPAHACITPCQIPHPAPNSASLLLLMPSATSAAGIGDVAAAMCAYEVLHTCGAHIKEIIYFGTSGWSPAKGGLLDVDSCGEANTQPQVTR
jgi:hypothetical protein